MIHTPTNTDGTHSTNILIHKIVVDLIFFFGDFYWYSGSSVESTPHLWTCSISSIEESRMWGEKNQYHHLFEEEAKRNKNKITTNKFYDKWFLRVIWFPIEHVFIYWNFFIILPFNVQVFFFSLFLCCFFLLLRLTRG